VELLLLAVMAVSTGLGALRLWLVRHRASAWEQVARELGLRLSGTARSGLELNGRIGEWSVSVREWRGERESAQTEFQVDGRGIPKQLSLSRERLFFQGLDIPIGDEEFDREICVQNEELKALAVLNGATRSIVRNVFARREVTVRGGAIRHGVDRWMKEAPQLRSCIEDLVRLAGALVLPPGEVPERLARNAASDDLPSVRLRNLELLHRHFQGTEIAREAFLKAIEDRSLEVRLAGATYLGDLKLLARIAGIETVDLSIRLRAVRQLVEAADAEQTGPLLERLLSTPAPLLLKAVVGGIGQLRYRPAAAKLVALLGRADAETARATAETLGRVGDTAAEPALLSLLERGEPAVQIAAARALGQVGTVQAVEPLLVYTRGLLDSELKRAAREAVGAIQARLGNVEGGRLSLAGLAANDGALSLGREESGALSFEEEGSSGEG